MKRPAVTRRRVLGALGGLGAVVLTPALAWRSMASTRAATPPAGGPAQDDRPTNVIHGKVVSLSSESDFTLDTRFASGVRVLVEHPDQEPLYPPGHSVKVGDELWANGYWEGPIDASTFIASNLEFNVERYRGTITRLAGDEGSFSVYDPRKDVTRMIMVVPANIAHGTVDGQPADDPRVFLDLPNGTGVDVIGYRDPSGRLVVTYIDAYPRQS